MSGGPSIRALESIFRESERRRALVVRENAQLKSTIQNIGVQHGRLQERLAAVTAEVEELRGRANACPSCGHRLD